MKKQIGGKRYSTAAARKIGYGEDEKGTLGCLYVKRNGEAFIVNSQKEVIPLEEEDALLWARENNLIVQYVAAIDYAVNDKQQVSVYLTDYALSSLKKLCDLWETTQSETVEKLLQDGFERATEIERIKEQLLKELNMNYGFRPQK